MAVKIALHSATQCATELRLETLVLMVRPCRLSIPDIRETPLWPPLGKQVVEFDTSTGICSEYYGFAATPAHLHRDPDEVSTDNCSVPVQEHNCSREQVRNEALGLNPTECTEVTHVVQQGRTTPDWYVILWVNCGTSTYERLNIDCWNKYCAKPFCFVVLLFRLILFSPPIGGVTPLYIKHGVPVQWQDQGWRTDLGSGAVQPGAGAAPEPPRRQPFPTIPQQPYYLKSEREDKNIDHLD